MNSGYLQTFQCYFLEHFRKAGPSILAGLSVCKKATYIDSMPQATQQNLGNSSPTRWLIGRGEKTKPRWGKLKDAKSC